MKDETLIFNVVVDSYWYGWAHAKKFRGSTASVQSLKARRQAVDEGVRRLERRFVKAKRKQAR